MWFGKCREKKYGADPLRKNSGEWYKKSVFQYLTGILMTAAIIFLLGKIDYVFVWLGRISAALFSPILAAGFLYYLLRPVLRLLIECGIPRIMALIIIFLVLGGLLSLLVVYAGRMLAEEAGRLSRELPEVTGRLGREGQELIEQNNYAAVLYGKLRRQAGSWLGGLFAFVSGGAAKAAAWLPRLSKVLITTPFILYFFLKDSKVFCEKFIALFPCRYQAEVMRTGAEIDGILSAYTTGQFILAVMAGVFSITGYLIIGLPYGLILAVFMMLAAFIPTFGLMIGAAPALLVGLTGGLHLVLKVLMIFIVITMARKLIAPYLIAGRLNIHPLVVIFVLLAAGSLFGFIGVLIGVPVYAAGVEIWKGVKRAVKSEV